MAASIVLSYIFIAVDLAVLTAEKMAGTAIAIRIPMMTITTRSSTSVKPVDLWGHAVGRV